jgi:uroporphyrinogen decarboxylase
MNSTERVLAALERKVPDRVPTFEWAIDSGVINTIVPGADFYDFIERMELDAVPVRPDYKKEIIDNDTYREETGLLKKKMTEDYLVSINKVIKDEKDLARFEFPDPSAPHRFNTMKKVIERFKGKKAIIAWLRDGFAEVRDLHGFEETLIDFYDRPGLIGGIIEKAVDYYTEIARIARKLGAEVVLTGDDIAGKNGLFMSPRHFREIIHPAMKRLYKNFRDLGFLVIKHTDGDLMPIMDDLIETGLDCLDPIDPSAGMNIALIKRKYGGRICIKGNINCAGSLVYGTPGEVEKETRRCIEVAGKNGGYICSSSNSIHSSVIPENYIAMLNAVKKYGVY